MPLSPLEVAKIALVPRTAERIGDSSREERLKDLARAVASLRNNLYHTAGTTAIVLVNIVRVDDTPLRYAFVAMASMLGYMTVDLARDLYGAAVELGGSY